MRRITPETIKSFIGKDVRLVYPVEQPIDEDLVIMIDHKITPHVILLEFIPPSKAKIQRADGSKDEINFEEIWDPSPVKPILKI